MDIQIEKAEQQLIGFIHAKRGYNLLSLINDMGLLPNEWVQIKKNGMHIPQEMKEEIDNHFLSLKIKNISKEEANYGNRMWE